MIIAIFSGEFIFQWIINIPFIHYFTDEEVKDYKDNMFYFSNTHQNPVSGLFLEPSIEACYRAIDSINFSSTAYESDLTNLINPINNTFLNLEHRLFFLDYLFEKQNSDGSFSDIGGIGNIYSTFKVIKTIDLLNSSYLDNPIRQKDVDNIIDFINRTMEQNGWGFRYHPFINQSDIISTFYAIKLAKRFNSYSLVQNSNITEFINSTRYLAQGGYGLTSYSPLVTQETTYFGIKAHLEMNSSIITPDDKVLLGLYFLLRRNLIGGGYSNTIGGVLNVESTYYAIKSQSILNITVDPFNETQSLNYILSCQESNGGFGNYPSTDLNDTSSKSGWAAMKCIVLLENNTADHNSEKIIYYNWIYEKQAMNGLIGQVSLQSNYQGVLSLYNYDISNYKSYLKMDNILRYTDLCYNSVDGGFGPQPNRNSSIFSTYCAIFLYQLFQPYNITYLPNETNTELYFTTLQNPDGGYKLGEDLDVIISFFGSVYEPMFDIINTNISTIISTYWAVSSLNNLDSLDLVNKSTLYHWIYSCQNADGGFSLFIGFHSDVISTYYALETLRFFNLEPISRISAIKFLKNAQKRDGSFHLIPYLSLFFDLPSSFIGNYLGSISLYYYRDQPQDMPKLADWFRNCFSNSTGGVGDYPMFGGDLRNTPYGLLIIDDIRYDQAFDPFPWTRLILWLVISEVVVLLLIIAINMLSYINISVTRILKLKLGIRDKLNVEYLKRFKAINCENLEVYSGKKLIVDGVSLELDHGEILGVLGESGAGKSTFIKALLGMRKYKGICEIYGMDAKKNKKKFRPIFGYVPQDLGKIYNNFTTLQNLIYFGNQYGLTEKQIISKAKRLLRSLEIEDKMHSLVKTLSGGQKRRVSIAMGLIHNPIFCILDEPTSGLDPVVRENLWLALTRINEMISTTLLVISHYPEESRFCNKIVVFGRKRGMIDFGTPKDLLYQLPGRGRTIEITFNDIYENGIQKLESIEGIDKALENKVGITFVLLTDLNLHDVKAKIENEFGIDSILELKQSDAKMEEYFRYKALEVKKLE
ncbi:MAG: ATP-binding cassette domain-containing protein [Candidatus Lokiarchaeota archaeon]|nr:ATP-binding cassette domain-containing protein [Candidatus Lokiarchaeota archaeon]